MNHRSPLSGTFLTLGAITLACALVLLPLRPVLAAGRQGGAVRGVGVKIKTEDGRVIDLYKGSYALVIGVSDYSAGWPKLPGVKKDIEVVSVALERHGFLVTKVENPDSVQLDKSFREFIDTYGQAPDNRLLFYFAGHGHTLKQAYGEEMGYVVPADAPNPNLDQGGFRSKAMSMEQTELYAKRIQSKHALFLFDSCFSGSLFGMSRAVPENIGYKTSRPVRQFITSGSADEQVPDQSIFRRQFVEALEGEADVNRDGYVTGTELGEFLQDRVVNYTKNSQHPQYGKIRNPNLDKGDFVFMLPKAAGDALLAAGNAAAAPPKPAQPLDPAAVELEFWQTIKNSTNPEEFKAYLEKYPQGQFAALARMRANPAPPRPNPAEAATPTPQSPPAARPSTPSFSASSPAYSAPRPAPVTAAMVEGDFAEALSVVRENYVGGQSLDYGETYKSSIIGMLRALDPHSNFYDAKEFEEIKNDWRSQYFGIGATIAERRAGGSTDTYVLATFEGAPAARAGLRFGDRIVEVNGQSMRGKTFGDVRDQLRGPRGSAVRVTVERAATRAVETLEIKRDAVPQPAVPDAYMLRPGVGYIALTRGFNSTTLEEFNGALEALRRQDMQSLVLDLRDNGGGIIEQAVRVAERFLSEGRMIVTQKGRDASKDRAYRSSNKSPVGTPLVILVNRGTASASEIVAGALQDHDRALIIGEASFGKGLVQSIITLESGTALTLTTAKYMTPSGRVIQRDYSEGNFYDYFTRGGVGGGIAPDEAVKARTLTASQQRLLDPIFFFVRELVNGRVAGFEQYTAQRPIDFGRDIQPSDFPVTGPLFDAFKAYVAAGSYKFAPAILDRNRDFIARQMRYDMATAAYGVVTAAQVLTADDPQVIKAVDAIPRARELSGASAGRR